MCNRNLKQLQICEYQNKNVNLSTSRLLWNYFGLINWRSKYLKRIFAWLRACWHTSQIKKWANSFCLFIFLSNLKYFRLHKQTLHRLSTWYTSYEKLSALNAFVACGVLYVVNYDRLVIDYIYNTTSKTEARVSWVEVAWKKVKAILLWRTIRLILSGYLKYFQLFII